MFLTIGEVSFDLCPFPWIWESKLDSGQKDNGLEEDEASIKLGSVDT